MMQNIRIAMHTFGNNLSSFSSLSLLSNWRGFNTFVLHKSQSQGTAPPLASVETKTFCRKALLPSLGSSLWKDGEPFLTKDSIFFAQIQLILWNYPRSDDITITDATVTSLPRFCTGKSQMIVSWEEPLFSNQKYHFDLLE